MRSRNSLPVKAWPPADLRLWDALFREASPFDDPGPLHRLRPASRRSLRWRWSAWLGWLASVEQEALQEEPTARPQPRRVASWIEAMPDLAPASKAALVEGIVRIVSAGDPSADLGDLRRILRSLHARARIEHGARKHGRIVSSAALLDAGLRLAGAEAESAPTELATMRLRRDGAMIAFLALMPIRRRAFVELELGRSLRVGPDRIEVALDEVDTKTGKPWEAQTPRVIEPVLRRYLEEVRPWLTARGATAHDAFGVSDCGKPYHEVHLGRRITRLTEKALGVPVPPHFFRDAAATTLARSLPDAARMTRALLGHSSYRTAERHYNHAQGIEVGRDYATLVQRLREGER